MMKNNHMLGPLAAILLYTALAAADSESQLLVSSKCKLLEVTSRTVITELPTGAKVEHLVRDIKIICKNCTGHATSSLKPQCNAQPPPEDECYNQKCLYRKSILEKSKQVNAVPHHEHIKQKDDHWVQKPTSPPAETTRDLHSMSDAP